MPRYLRLPARLLRQHELAGEINYTVEFTHAGAADGTCNRKTRRIVIADRLAPNGRLVTLIHELSHALVGLEPDAKLTYAQEELIVESIAWSCCQTVGLDTSANSIPYLASWAEQASLEVLEQAAAITGRLATGNRPSCSKNFNNNANPSRVAPDLFATSSQSRSTSVQQAISSSGCHSRRTPSTLAQTARPPQPPVRAEPLAARKSCSSTAVRRILGPVSPATPRSELLLCGWGQQPKERA